MTLISSTAWAEARAATQGSAMTKIPIPGLKIYRDRTGKLRCYHRKSATAIDLGKFPPGSDALIAEVARITKLHALAPAPKPGTLGLLIKEYLKSDSFLSKASRTREDYRACFDYLTAIADTPLFRFKPSLVVQIRDKAVTSKGRKWGNYVKVCLSLLFAWGLERGYVEANPARGIRNVARRKDEPRANRPWADHEREAVMAALPAHLRLPFGLMMYCGADPVDVRSMPKTAIKDGRISTRRAKTGVEVWRALPAPLAAIAAQAPKHDAITLCATTRGTPWTKTGLESAWRPVRLALEAEGAISHGLTMKGLRHTVGTILAELGWDERAIADFLGQKTVEMARHYSNRADRTAKIDRIVTSLDAELARRRTKNV